ncbi:MAG: hypothetical protein COC23_00180 [Hyphomicrobiales bacterium]|nr:MAG: hypothetical protein COC23_00180 [Hyphomicrobiales bacterium]
MKLHAIFSYVRAARHRALGEETQTPKGKMLNIDDIQQVAAIEMVIILYNLRVRNKLIAI